MAITHVSKHTRGSPYLSMPKNKGEARAQAVDWQNWQSEQSMSWGEVSMYQQHFEKTGKKFGLTREFRENAII